MPKTNIIFGYLSILKLLYVLVEKFQLADVFLGMVMPAEPTVVRQPVFYRIKPYLGALIYRGLIDAFNEYLCRFIFQRAGMG